MFPWQIKQWQQLQRAIKLNRLPHALLFTGIAGTGKTQFAEDFMRALLCVKIEEGACNECHACRLMQNQTHPDVLQIVPEKEGQAIKIDQIREVTEFISQSTLKGRLRIVIINPADDMNANAANALLKTLEEPASFAHLVLISHQAQRLPATVLSRCQRILFPLPAKAEVLPWLKSQLPDEADADLLLRLANGAPLKALELLQEEGLILRKDFLQAVTLLNQKEACPLQVAAQFQKIEPIKLIDFMLAWVMDLIRLQVGCDKVFNQDYLKQLLELKQQRELKSNTNFMAYLQNLRGQICTGINLNKQLVVESMLIRWRECV